jgi:hypothetical protein
MYSNTSNKELRPQSVRMLHRTSSVWGANKRLIGQSNSEPRQRDFSCLAQSPLGMRPMLPCPSVCSSGTLPSCAHACPGGSLQAQHINTQHAQAKRVCHEEVASTAIAKLALQPALSAEHSSTAKKAQRLSDGRGKSQLQCNA